MRLVCFDCRAEIIPRSTTTPTVKESTMHKQKKQEKKQRKCKQQNDSIKQHQKR